MASGEVSSPDETTTATTSKKVTKKIVGTVTPTSATSLTLEGLGFTPNRVMLCMTTAVNWANAGGGTTKIIFNISNDGSATYMVGTYGRGGGSVARYPAYVASGIVTVTYGDGSITFSNDSSYYFYAGQYTYVAWWETPPPRGYGDGSLNTVSLGYESASLLCNGSVVACCKLSNYNNSSNYRWTTSSNLSNVTSETQSGLFLYTALSRGINILRGNTVSDISGLSDYQYKFLDTGGILLTGFQAGISGTNSSIFANTLTGAYTVGTDIGYGSYTTSIYLSSLKYTVNNIEMTLQEMIDAGACKPLVLFTSNDYNGTYYFGNAFNLFGGGQTDSGSYPGLRIFFMLNDGFTLSGISFYASKARGSSNYEDGLRGVAAWKTEDLEFTILEK